MKKLIFGDDQKPIGIESTKNNYSLTLCSSSIADAVLKQHHYSKTVTKNRFASFTINKGLGYIQLGYGIKPKQKYTISPLINETNYAEFDRMWLSDELPQFAESQVISLLLSYLKQAMTDIKFLITYADSSVGNIGTIYQATNAIYLGSVNVDFYLLPDGTRIHPVTMWHRHKTRAKAFVEKEYPGIRHVRDGRQHRYLYVLDRNLRRQFVEGRLDLPFYPKREESSEARKNLLNKGATRRLPPY